MSWYNTDFNFNDSKAKLTQGGDGRVNSLKI